MDARTMLVFFLTFSSFGSVHVSVHFLAKFWEDHVLVS